MTYVNFWNSLEPHKESAVFLNYIFGVYSTEIICICFFLFSFAADKIYFSEFGYFSIKLSAISRGKVSLLLANCDY